MSAAAEAGPEHLSLSATRQCRQDLGRQLHVPGVGECRMTEAPQLLLAHHLKTLKLPTVLREYDKVAQQCAAEGLDHVQFLARLVELELIDRERRMIERRIKAAFPRSKAWIASTSRRSQPQQDAGAGTGPLRVDRAAGKRHRPRQQRHRQDPCRSRAGAGRLSEGPRRRLHHRRRLGP